MEPIAELFKQLTPSTVAGIFFWLYLRERNENKRLQEQSLQDAKLGRTNAEATRDKTLSTMSETAEILKGFSRKIRTVQKGK